MLPVRSGEEGLVAAAPSWEREGEHCLARLLEALGFLRRGEWPEALDSAFVLESLDEAWGRLLEAFRSDVDPPVALRSAIVALDRALAPLLVLGAQEPTLAGLSRALQTARSAATSAAELAIGVVWSSPPPLDELRASQDSLRLQPRVFPPWAPALQLELPPLPEVTSTPPEPPAPATFEELQRALNELRARAASRSSAKKESGASEPGDDTRVPASSPTEPRDHAETAFLQQRSQECFEDLSALCIQRAPQPGEHWQGAALLELRMRACVDGIAALGRTGLAHLEPLVLLAPALDPARLTALTLTCGAVDGRDSLAFGEWALQELLAAFPEASAELYEAFAEGLGLVPHPGVVRVCAGLLRSESTRARGVAIDTLGRRGEATHEQLLECLADEDEVAAVALPLYAEGRPGDLRERIDDCLARGGEALQVAAWRTMVIAGDPRVNGYLAEHLRSGEVGAEAALLLGIHAERRDAERLLEEVTASPTPALVEALGFAGAPFSVPCLIGLLDRDDLELKLAAAGALTRITGQELWEEILIDPERLQTGGATPQEEALAPGTIDPRNPPAEASLDKIELPTMRSEPWSAYWQAHGGNFDASQRYRRGHPHEARVLVDELLVARASRRERRAIHWELMSRLGRPIPLDVRDWVDRQLSVLQSLQGELSSSASAGSWALPTWR